MNLRSSILILVFSLGLGQWAAADTPQDAQWAPVPELTDEFSGPVLDASKWWDHNPTWKGREPGFFSPKNVTVENGEMVLTARAEDLPDLPEGYHTFTTAAVKSKALVLYGYFEVRCKPMNSKASSSFWFYESTDEIWTEIDVFEMGAGAPDHKNKYHTTLHVMHAPGITEHLSDTYAWEAPFNLADDYHIYGFEWDENWMKWYVDGRLIRTKKNDHWHQPLRMNFDSETMPEWFGLPDKETLPATYRIDYVRTWKKIDAPTPSYPTQSTVRIGADHFLERNGTPLFPIGAYALPKGMSYAQGRAMGFNLIHLSDDPSAWDEATKAGLNVWHSFSDNLDFASGDVQKKKSAIQKTVQDFSGHPALLFWESMDEPAWSNENPAQARATAEGLTTGYQYLQDQDNRHLVYLNHAPRNTVDTLRNYDSACDIVCVDIYPIIPPGLRDMYAITPEGRHGDLPNQTPSCVGEYVDKMRAVANGRQSVFVVLQGFAWEALRGEKTDPALIRYPSYQESRFMAWNAILHGANGLMVWGLSYVPSDHPFLQDLGKVLQEIEECTPLILSPNRIQAPTPRYHERGSSIAGGIEIIGRETKNGVYLIAVNTSMDPAAADFTNLPLRMCAGTPLSVIGENREVKVENGMFMDEFKGFDVHIYFLKNKI